jgi:hypothetical protein
MVMLMQMFLPLLAVFMVFHLNLLHRVVVVLFCSVHSICGHALWRRGESLAVRIIRTVVLLIILVLIINSHRRGQCPFFCQRD